MKKLTLIIILGSFLGITGLSQTSINYNTHGHVVGDVVEWWNMTIPNDTIYPGPSGEDVTWVFTSHVATYSFSNEYLDPANTPFASQVSGSNLAVYHNIVNNDAYTFCNITSQSIEHTGGGWVESGGQLYYDFSDPVTLQKYPFSYEDEYSDGFSYSIDYNQLGYDMELIISGTLTVVADAWGQIQTPLGIYDNVLRIQETYNETVSTYIEGQLISTNATVEYFYKWYAPNRRAAVYEYHYISGDPDSHAIIYSDNSVGVEQEESLELEIYPNPASNYIRIKLKNACDILSVRLVNNLGQIIRHSEINSQNNFQASFQVSGLVEGFYVLNINTSEGDVINRKILIKR